MDSSDLDRFFIMEKFSEKERLETSEDDGFYFLKAGHVRIELKQAAKFRSIAIAGPQEVVGGIFEGGYKYSGRPVGEVQAYFIDHAKLVELVTKEPKIYRELMLAMRKTLSSREKQLYIMGKRSVKERISGILLHLAEIFNNQNDNVIQVDKTTVADLANTTLETFSRTLTEFENEGILRRVGHYIEVMNKTKLQRYFE